VRLCSIQKALTSNPQQYKATIKIVTIQLVLPMLMVLNRIFASWFLRFSSSNSSSSFLLTAVAASRTYLSSCSSSLIHSYAAAAFFS
jgi:membrane-anchored protein YejM (alkaline phosphatase superfamily)